MAILLKGSLLRMQPLLGSSRNATPNQRLITRALHSFPFLLRTNNMHVTVSSYTNHISRYICRQRSRFPRNGSLLLIGPSVCLLLD